MFYTGSVLMKELLLYRYYTNEVSYLGGFLCKERTMRVESDSDYYYEILNINERLRELVVKKHKSIYNATKILDKKGLNLYKFIGSLEVLYTICEALDIDFGYCLTGKESFKGYDLNKLVDVYSKNRYKTKKPNSIAAIISLIRHGKNNIKIATLLKISNLLKKKLSEII